MFKLQLRKPILAAMGVCLALAAAPGFALADDASDIQALKNQIQTMQQQIDQLSVAKTTPAPTMAPAAAKAPPSGSLTYAGVTLYGTIDMGVAYLSHGAPISSTWGPGLPYFIQNFSNHPITSIAGNGLSQSKVGLSGVEPLIGDWSAVFRLETGFNPWSGRLTDGPASLVANNGKPASVKISAGDSSRAGQAFNGATYVGISSKSLGTLTFGRQNGLMLDNLAKYDPQQQAQAFSPIALSGTSGGLGDTESNRMDNSAKYVLAIGPIRASAIHQFGSDGYVPESGNEADLGFDLGGFSIDALWGVVHGEIAAASLPVAPPPPVTTPPTPPTSNVGLTSLAATVSDNTAYSVQSSFNAKEFFPVKFYGGWERIKYNNPEHPIPVGTVDYGGYLLSTVNNTAYYSLTTRQRILQISWFGARYSITPNLDLTGAYYMYNQKSNNANGCTNTSAATCAGELHDTSLVIDWHLSKRFDTYAGLNYSLVQNGLASGFLYTSAWVPMVGLRFNF
jgi:predicted porin